MNTDEKTHDDEYESDNKNMSRASEEYPQDQCIITNNEEEQGWTIYSRKKPKFNAKVREALFLNEDVACVSWEVEDDDNPQNNEDQNTNNNNHGAIEYFEEQDRELTRNNNVDVEEINVNVEVVNDESTSNEDNENSMSDVDDADLDLIPSSIVNALNQLTIRELNLSEDERRMFSQRRRLAEARIQGVSAPGQGGWDRIARISERRNNGP